MMVTITPSFVSYIGLNFFCEEEGGVTLQHGTPSVCSTNQSFVITN